MSDASPLLVACLTPPGSAAIAVLAVRGSGAWDAVAKRFQPRSGNLPPFDEVRPGQVWLGRFGQGQADDVVLVAQRVVPTPWVEIHCHGGREVVAWLLELLQQAGAEIDTWQRMESRTTDDPLQALALAALAHAPTVRTASILLDQVQGAFGREMQSIRVAQQSGQTDEVEQRLAALARYAPVGRHLVQPWRVVVAGAVNAGKSSLVNALAGYQRSIVTPLPGTTRDVVTVRIAVDGWPIELADTAGLRPGGEALEEQGMQRAREAVAQADLCLWVLDASAEPVWPVSEVIQPLLVINKTDLPAAWNLDQVPDAVRLSALTGAGLETLCQRVAQRLVPHPPPPGAAVPISPEPTNV